MMKKLMVIIFGIVFLGVGIFMIIQGKDMAKRCTTPATGTVVEIIEEKEENTDSEGAIIYDSYTYTYYPVIEFKAEEKTIKEKYSTGSGKSKYNVGDKIDILYDANKPEDYLIVGDSTNNILGIIFTAAGVIVVLIGIFKRNF